MSGLDARIFERILESKKVDNKSSNSILRAFSDSGIDVRRNETYGELFLPAGVQLYGVEHKPLIDVNDNSRPSEEYVVVIGALASGDPILFKKDSEQIAIYNQSAGKIEDDEIYDDFFAFLNDLYDLLGIGG